MDLHGIIRGIESKHLKRNIADVRVGETVKVHYKIREGNKERIQIFEGLVIATKSGTSLQGNFTVRKVVTGVGVERTFPLHSPWLVKIERIKSGKVRRAKLNFVREYALSSKFKLKDKGKPGSVWEEVAEQKAQVEDERRANESSSAEADASANDEQPTKVEQTEEKTDNATEDDQATENAGTDGGESGSESPEEAKASDPGSEPSN